MTNSLQVLLGDTPVGHLSRNTSGRITFRFAEHYKNLENRPVLSQHFEDDLERIYAGKDQDLPAFFANLIPEPGPLRSLLEHSLGVPPKDDLALLEAVGDDLPGAVRVRPSDDPEDMEQAEAEIPENDVHHPEENETTGLRFSLAGVQMKFSVLWDSERITLPAHNQLGEWILKIGSPKFPFVVENEYCTMEWARATGFDVPECHIQAIETISSTLRQHAATESNAFLIRRYDRAAGRRIHQEDFAQVASLQPRLKYDHLRYETCARLIMAIAGPKAYEEFIQRLVFTIASGNGDAHAKNWSFLYPDGVEPVLTPMYDQVSTIAWPNVSAELALKLMGTKNWLRIDQTYFDRLAEKAGASTKSVKTIVDATLEQIAAAWNSLPARNLLPDSHQVALETLWQRAPLLRRFVGTMKFS